MADFHDGCVALNIKGVQFGGQVFTYCLMTIFMAVVLKPLGVPVMVSHYAAGIIFGPLLAKLPESMFGNRVSIPAYAYAHIGVVFQLFLIGVQTKPTMLLRAGRKEIVIGFTVVLLPLILNCTCAAALVSSIAPQNEVSPSLFIIAAFESISTFPVIACYLLQLNIVNSEFSNVAITSSMISGLFSYVLMLIGSISWGEEGGTLEFTTRVVFYLFVVGVVMLLKKAITWVLEQTPEGHRVKDKYVCFVLLAVVWVYYLCELGQVISLFGPFVFGVIIPPGPPLGSRLVEAVEYLNTWMVMPVYYAQLGMEANIFSIKPTNALIVGLLLVVNFTGKFLGAFIPAFFFNMSFNDAVLLGLTMNVQGFLELSAFSYLVDMEVIDIQSFRVMSLSILIIPAVSAPLVRRLYQASLRNNLQITRNIQHSEPNAELKVLGYLHDEDYLPSIIRLLKAINPTKDSPINVTIIHFEELGGGSLPQVIYHKLKKPSATTTVTTSQRIINAFRQYEDSDKESISLHPYTVVSSYAAIHNDVYNLALEKLTSIIILPYHKEVRTGLFNPGRRTVNCNVLGSAPCSVGVLIDRGVFGGMKYVSENWSSCDVAVLFLGDADDREALAIGERMSSHPTINLTVIRILKKYNENRDRVEKSLDDEMVINFRTRTAHNTRVKYIEEEAGEGFEFIKKIQSLNSTYELIIVGRRHDRESPLILELTDWNKCSELGTIGDIFTTSEDYDGKATVLVVQQHIRELEFGKDAVLLSRTFTYDC